MHHALPRKTSSSDGRRGSGCAIGPRARGASGALGRPQLGRAGARIGGDLGVVRRQRPARSAGETSAPARADLRQMARAAARRRPRSARKVLTMRSSSEWNDTTTSRPPGLSTRFGGRERRGELAELLVDEDAQRLERAGRRMNGARARRARRARSRRRAREWCAIGACARAATMARATRAGVALLAQRRDDDGEIALGGVPRSRRRRSDRQRPCACRAGRRSGTRSRARPRRAASRRRRDRSTTPSTASWPQLAHHPLEIGEAVLRPESSRPPACLRPGRRRARSRWRRGRCRSPGRRPPPGSRAYSRRRRRSRRHRRRRRAPPRYSTTGRTSTGM